MKIENNHLNPVIPQSRPEGVQSGSKATPPVTNTQKDQVQLSEQARLLSKARSAVENTPEIRTERVQELKQQVVNGNYSIPYTELARRLYPVVTESKE